MNRERTKNLNVRISEEEDSMLTAVAKHEGLSVSDWVRQAVRQAYRRLLAEQPKPRKKVARG